MSEIKETNDSVVEQVVVAPPMHASTNNEPTRTSSNSADEFKEIHNLNQVPSKQLQTWNIVAACFQFAQCIALFYLSGQADTKWYWYTHFPANLDERADDQADGDFGRPTSDQVAAFSVTWYSAVFILLSGLDHLLVTLPGIRSKYYEYYIARHQNPFRWTEYSVSASLMRVMIAQLSGITDIHLLFCIFVLAAITMVLGAVHESVNAKARADGFKMNWFPFLAAWIPHLASWAVIYCYFFKAVIEASPPNFVYAIVFILFVLDGTFAILFYLQWAKIGYFKDYVRGEFGFIVLSFTAKSLLAWINYGGGSR